MSFRVGSSIKQQEIMFVTLHACNKFLTPFPLHPHT